MPGPLPPIEDVRFSEFKTKQARKVKPMFLSALKIRQGISLIADNGSGLIRITTDGVHGLANNDQVIIDGATGTMAINGFWKVTQINTTSFDLQSSSSTGTWTGGGSVCDGESYTIQMDATSASILVLADVKDMAAGGSINDAIPIVKKVTTAAVVEIARSIQTYKRMFQSLTVQNNDGATKTGDIRLRTTVAQGNIDEKIIPFELPTENKLVIGIDALQWMFKATGLPYVS